MNKEWSELNKTMQMQIKSRSSFCDGMMTLLLLLKTNRYFLRVITKDVCVLRSLQQAMSWQSRKSPIFLRSLT